MTAAGRARVGQLARRDVQLGQDAVGGTDQLAVAAGQAGLLQRELALRHLGLGNDEIARAGAAAQLSQVGLRLSQRGLSLGRSGLGLGNLRAGSGELAGRGRRQC